METSALCLSSFLSLSSPNFPNFLPIDFIFEVTKLVPARKHLQGGEGGSIVEFQAPDKRSLLLYTAVGFDVSRQAMESDARVSRA